MIDVKCLGSSSSGNAYIFTFSDTNEGWADKILVEAGFSEKELIKRAVLNNTALDDIKAVLITHNHSDHSCGALSLSNKGFKVYASAKTLRSLNIDYDVKQVLYDYVPKYLTSHVSVLPFLVKHDAPDPMGFIIRGAGENILFINDCGGLETSLSGYELSLIFIEYNYFDQYLHIELSNATKENNRVIISRLTRIRNNHLGLSRTKKILKSLNLSKCRGIFLMHLSDKNSDEKKSKKEIAKIAPNIPVYVCCKNGGFQS